jgi:hypothetical protein
LSGRVVSMVGEGRKVADEECSRSAASHVLAVNVDRQSANGEMRRWLIGDASGESDKFFLPVCVESANCAISPVIRSH